MFKELESIYSKLLKPFVLRVSGNWGTSFVFVVFIYAVLVPLLDYLKHLVVNFSYSSVYFSVYNFLSNNLRLTDYLFLILLLLIFSFLAYFYKQLAKTSIVKDSFDSKNLNKWSIPTDAGWTIQDCDDAPGRMLSITNTSEPGTLKDIYGWFDYEISFLCQLKSSPLKSQKNSISIFVRTESSKNGIMLELDQEKFNPFILHDGIYIQDAEGSSRLPTMLELNKWYPVKIVVSGDCIDITVANYRLQQYRIQTRTFSVEKKVLNNFPEEPTLKDIIASDIRVNKSFRTWLDLFNKSGKEEDPAKKADLVTQERSAWKAYTDLDRTPLVLEHQKGSVGFRAIGQMHTNIKNVVVKKLS